MHHSLIFYVGQEKVCPDPLVDLYDSTQKYITPCQEVSLSNKFWHSQLLVSLVFISSAMVKISPGLSGVFFCVFLPFPVGVNK